MQRDTEKEAINIIIFYIPLTREEEQRGVRLRLLALSSLCVTQAHLNPCMFQ